MLGTIVNAGAIILGGVIGLLFFGKVKEKYTSLIFDCLGLAVILIGLLNAFEMKGVLVVIFSLVIGSIIGQAIDIEKRLETFSNNIEKRLLKGKPEGSSNISFSKGFITTTLIYCIGSMAIVGSFESGLTGKHDTLFAKAAIDGMASILFGSTLGFGVPFSAIPIFLYQGGLTLSASFLKPYLTDIAIADMTSVGGLIIVAIGLNMMNIKKIPVANMLPGIFLPLLYYAIM